jgi:LysR family transcriptional regulator, chromosome initiation inhibitor
MPFSNDQLAAFAEVIRQGSFQGAAQALRVTPSAISQRIKQLEEHVGGIVVVRGKRCTATATGDLLYRHALQVELLERDLLRSVRPGRGEAAQVAVAVNADSLATWLMPALARFSGQTGVQIELVVDNQDNTAEWLRSGRVLGAVTSEARPVQGCRAEPLGVMRYRATASPAFVRRWLSGRRKADALCEAPALMFNQKDDLPLRLLREAFGRRGARLRAMHLVPSATAYVEGCVLGLGWGVNPEKLVEAHLAAERLVDLCPRQALEVPLFWQQWSLASETLDALSAALKSEAAAALLFRRRRRARPRASAGARLRHQPIC